MHIGRLNLLFLGSRLADPGVQCHLRGGGEGRDGVGGEKHQKMKKKKQFNLKSGLRVPQSGQKRTSCQYQLTRVRRVWKIEEIDRLATHSLCHMKNES